jgi:hypothetical protein
VSGPHQLRCGQAIRTRPQRPWPVFEQYIAPGYVYASRFYPPTSLSSAFVDGDLALGELLGRKICTGEPSYAAAEDCDLFRVRGGRSVTATSNAQWRRGLTDRGISQSQLGEQDMAPGSHCRVWVRLQLADANHASLW